MVSFSSSDIIECAVCLLEIGDGEKARINGGGNWSRIIIGVGRGSSSLIMGYHIGIYFLMFLAVFHFSGKAHLAAYRRLDEVFRGFTPWVRIR